MRLELDENLGRRGLEALQAAGHDVATVWEQIGGLASRDVTGRLWIVQPGTLREDQPEQGAD